MIRLVFSRSFEAGYWPGPLENARASAGESWVGPGGLVSRLELELGLDHPHASHAGRVAALIPLLKSKVGFWSRSAEIDPIGSAEVILRWRDLLWLHGWRDQGVAPRFEQISALFKGFPGEFAGLPERVVSVLNELHDHPLDIGSLTLIEPVDTLPRTLQVLVRSIEGCGVRLELRQPVPAVAGGDLAASRQAGFRPTGDGTLQLIRPHGLREAAEEAAAWISSLAGEQSTLIIGQHPLLDEALHRFGLPTTGASPGIESNPLLQVLPLVIDLGWNPPDPRIAHDLMSLSPSPVTPSLSRKLSEALQEWPSLSSDSWTAALEEGLASIDDLERRERIRTRLANIFTPSASRDGFYPLSGIESRIETIRGWLQGFLGNKDHDPGPWFSADHQCATFLESLRLSGITEFTRPLLERFLALASRSCSSVPPFDSEAGIKVALSPGSIVGPVKNTLWWSFHADSVPAIPAISMSPAEVRALEACGACIPPPATEAMRLAAEWRRPLEQTTGALALICPRLDEAGEESFPHPLWDEILVNLEDPGDARRICSPVARIPVGHPRRERRISLPEVKARRAWPVDPDILEIPSRLSPTRFSTLVGCSLKWAIDFKGRLRGCSASALPGVTDSRFIGTLVHHIFETMLNESDGLPEDPAGLAEEIFDREIERLATVFLLPGSEGARVTVRSRTATAAADLVQLCRESGLTVESIERKIEGRAFDMEFVGIPDMVFIPGNSIIDLKWGGVTYRSESLKNGTAYQLASYAYLVSGGNIAAFPDCGYYILKSARLLAVPEGAFQGKGLRGPSLGQTWEAMERAVENALEVLGTGALVAGGNHGDDGATARESDELMDGVLHLTAPCKFCDHGTLCGHTFTTTGS